jgi:hypothetical protein
MGELDNVPSYNIAASGTTLFASTGSGLYVVDASDPSTPRIAALIDSLRFTELASEGSRLYAGGYRGTSILDVSVPAVPSLLGSVDLYGFITPLGDRFLVSSDTLWVVDVSDPRSPGVIGSLGLPGRCHASAATAHYACVATTSEVYDQLDSLLVIDVSDSRHPTLVGILSLPGTTRTVAMANGYAYVGVGAMLTVVDLSDPTSPRIIDELPLSGYIQDLDVSEPLGLVATSGGLATVDLSLPQHPQVVDTIPLLPYYAGFVRLAVSSSRTFVEVTNPGGNCPVCDGYSILRVLEPANGLRPPTLGNIETQGYAWGATAKGSLVFIPADAAGLEIVDVSNLSQPTRLSTLDTPGEAIDVAVGGSLAVIADDPDIAVADVSDPQSPSLLAVLPDLSGARAVALADTVAYVAAGMFGLLAVDVSDPSSPVILASVRTPYYTSDVALSGHYAYVTDRAYGLFVVDIADPRAPRIVGSLDTPGNAMSVAVEGALAFIADDTSVRVVNISVPTSPVFWGSTGTPGSARGIAAAGTHVYVADIYSGLAVIDASTPSAPRLIGGDQGYVRSFGVSVGDHVYLADGSAGIHVFPLDCADVTDVQISGFAARSQADGMLLTWEAPEGQWASFQIERSMQSEAGYARITPGPLLPGTPTRFLDSSIDPGTTYYYRLEAQDRSGGISRSGAISARFDPPPFRTQLRQNRPNPFATQGLTSIVFSLGQESRVRLRIFDPSGREVRDLVDETLPYGEHQAVWDGRDDQGRPLSSGLYFYRLETPGFVSTRKMIKLR